MEQIPLVRRRAVRRLASLMVFAAAGCSTDHLTQPDDAVLLAAGGGTGNPTVSSTTPTAAQQDTTLDVHVFGSGFDRGSRADFLLHGVPTPSMTTNSTKFVSSTEVVANLTIAKSADTTSYDVQLTTSTGKKGIGSELFTVVPNTVPIAYTDSKSGKLAVMNVDGSNRTVLSWIGHNPSWAPGGDGIKVAYRVAFMQGAGTGCFVARIDLLMVAGRPQAGNYQCLSSTFTSPSSAYFPAWSPGATDEIAFSESSAGNSLWVMPAAGGAPVAVYTAPVGYYVTYSAWSTTGTRLAFIETARYPAPADFAIKILDRTTGGVTTVLRSSVLQPGSLDWARTKDELLFTDTGTSPSRSVYSLDLITLLPVKLASGELATWSPDDQQMAYNSADYKIVTRRLSSGAVSSITTSGRGAGWRR